MGIKMNLDLERNKHVLTQEMFDLLTKANQGKYIKKFDHYILAEQPVILLNLTKYGKQRKLYI